VIFDFMRSHANLSRAGVSALGLAALLLLSACNEAGATDDGDVRAHFSGTVVVRAEVDSAATNFDGFELLVLAQNAEGDLDTLGMGVTDTTGAFAFDLRAEDEGLYPFVISRRGQPLVRSEMVVADGDSTVLNLRLPTRSTLLPLRSPENAAWAAYRNTKAQYQAQALQLAQSASADIDDLAVPVSTAAQLLWSLGDTFPETLAARLARAESIMMLDGWNDSLVLARSRAIEAEGAGYAQVARVARRAAARLEGQDAALALLDSMIAATSQNLRPALRTEKVVALIDSNATEAAITEARLIQEEYAGTEWESWAERALYELQTLQPGLLAPDFSAVTREGDPLTLADLRGEATVLEFYQPRDAAYLQNLAVRNALVTSDLPLQYVSISVEPDEIINEALFEQGEGAFPGIHVFQGGGGGGSLADLYNVNVLPTRYLLDRDGRIVGKYVGASLLPLQEDLAMLFGER
jgi:hypothetical protein